MQLSDSEVIVKILEGNPDLFRVLVERYKSPVAAVIKGMIGDCPEAEDVGQETFIRLFNSLDGFRGDSALKTYVIRIAMNLSLNEIKKKKKHNNHNVFLDGTMRQFPGIEVPEAERSEIREMINIAVEKLDYRQRSVFMLRIVEGYSTKETAAMLNIPVGTVLSRLARALEEMRKMVKR